MPRFLRAIVEGTIYSIVIAAMVGGSAFFLPTPEYASRWEGTCSGWTRTSALWYLVGEMLHWWSYMTVAVVVHRLHPILYSVPYSAATVRGMVLFIFGCGFGHLLEAVAMFKPAYEIVVGWLIFNGLVSFVSAFLVAYSLTRAFDVIEKQRRRAADMEKKFGSLLPKG